MIAFAHQMADKPTQRPPPRGNPLEYQHPEPLFAIKQTVAVPVEVAESKLARIVGCEWGPNNHFRKAKATGWLYTLVFIPVGGLPEHGRLGVLPTGEGFLASEEELLSWHKEHAR